MEEMIAQCTQMMGQMGTMMNGMGSMMNGGMMDSVMNGRTWWASPWYWFGWVLVLALLAAVALAFVWAVRRTAPPSPMGETSIDILKRRFAQGKISPEQYEVMKQQLSEE